MIWVYLLSIFVSLLARLLELITLDYGLVKNNFKINKEELLEFYKKIVLGGNKNFYNLLLIIPGINFLISLVDEIRLLYITSDKKRLYKKFVSLGINIEMEGQKIQDVLNIIKFLETELINKKVSIELFSQEDLDMVNEIFASLEFEKEFCGKTIEDKIKTLKKEIEAHNSKIIAGLARIFEPLTDEELQASRIHIPGKKLMFVTDIKNVSDLFEDTENKTLGKRPKRNV